MTAYGAIPNCNAPFTSCSSDQTSAIQAAIDACAGFTSSFKNPSGCTIFFPMGNGTNNGAYYIRGNTGIGLTVLRTSTTALSGVRLVGECSAPGSGTVIIGTPPSSNPLNCTSIVTDQAIDMLVVGTTTSGANTFGVTVQDLSFADVSGSGTANGAIHLINTANFNLTNVACSKFTNSASGTGKGYCILLDGAAETQYGVIVNPSVSATVHPIQTTGGVSELNIYGGTRDCNDPSATGYLANSIGVDLGFTGRALPPTNGEIGVFGTHILNCATGAALFNTSVTQWQGVMELFDISGASTVGTIGLRIDGTSGGNFIGGSINDYETGVAIGLLGSPVPFDNRISASITPNLAQGVALNIVPDSLATTLISIPENYPPANGASPPAGIPTGSQFGSDLTLFSQNAATGTVVPTATSLLTTIANSATAPTNSTVAKLKSGVSPANVVSAATSDTQGAIGIVVNNGANPTSGTTYSQIATVGQANCVFDNATTVGDYVTLSSSTAGDCHDYGSGYPPSGQVLGIVLKTNATFPAPNPVSLVGPGQVAPAPPLRSSVTLTDEFFSASTSTSNLGELGWTNAGSSGIPAASKIGGVASHPGILQIQTGTTNNNVSALFLGTSTTTTQPIVTLSNIPWRAVFIFRQEQASPLHVSVRVGFADTPTTVPPTNGFFFQNTSASATVNWRGIAKTSAGSSDTGTGSIPLDANFHTYEIRNDGSNNIMFLIDGSQYGNVIPSTSMFIPSGAMQPFLQILATETGVNKLLDVDAFQFTMQVSR